MVGPENEIAGVDVVHTPDRACGWKAPALTSASVACARAAGSNVESARSNIPSDRPARAALQEYVLGIRRVNGTARSCMPACSGVREAFALLHRRHADTTLLQISWPPG